MSLATLINELNPQQKQAATTETKHSSVLAGAGYGKTKTILALTDYMICKGVPIKSKFSPLPAVQPVKLSHV